jgi:tetratricopeptide (TPR) repeat protein
MKRTGLIILFLLLLLPAMAQRTERKYIREGNKSYKEGKYANAEVDYRKAREKAKDPVVPDYNLGTALYKQEKYDKAAENFLSVAGKTDENKVKADAYYNLGNTFLQAKKLDEAIAAYKTALKYNPQDMDAKYNLLYALRLKKQQQQQQKQQNKNGQQDQKQKQNGENQQNQQQQQQQQDQQQQQQNQQRQKKQQQDQQNKKGQQPKPQPGKISKKDAERLLQALANDEKKVQEKVKKAKAKRQRVKTAINW